MSSHIPFDTFEQVLKDRNIIKLQLAKVELEEPKIKNIKKNISSSDEAQGSAAEETHKSWDNFPNRKVDYHVEQGSNEIVVKIRDGKTGEVIKQIPEEEFLRLTNRISDFNKNILDQTV